MFIKILQIAVPFIWFGAVGAISFMEAPLRFQAPNITLPLGVGIGYLVFHALNKVEIVLCALMLISFFFNKPKSKLAMTFFAVILAVLILQTFWLFPLLDERAMKIVQGNTVPHTSAHFIYVVFDSIKVLLLPALGISLTVSQLKETQ